MSRFKTVSSILAVTAVLLYAGSAFAQSTDTFEVSANVLASCSVVAGDMAFGDYDGGHGAALDATSTISVGCTVGTPWELSLSAGDSGNSAARTMANGPNSLFYNLFVDAGRTIIWDDGAAGSTVTGNGNGNAQDQTVFGRIPAGQTMLPAGTYLDTIVATVVY